MGGRVGARRMLVGVAFGLCVAAPRCATAQSASLLFGSYVHEDGTSGDRAYPSYGLRIDHALGRWILVELGTTYVPLRLTDYTVDSPRRIWDAPRYAADLQVQAQAPFGPFRPYVGLGVGLFR